MHFKQALSLALVATVSAQSSQSLSDVLAAQNSTLSTLNSLLQSTGLASQLNNVQNVTILAPSNDALNALLNNTEAASMLSDPGAVIALLEYHILNGSYMADQITNVSAFIPTTLTNETYANVTGGQRVEAKMSGGNVLFYSALKQNVSVVTANVNFTGGVIHIIDGVLSIPMNVTDTLVGANLTAAAGAIKTASLEAALGESKDITIFAPNNDAFNNIGNLVANLSTQDLAGILQYHVVSGTVAYSSDLANTTVTALNGQNLTITVENGAVFVNAARVTVPDLLISNGVVHVIDQVLNAANSTALPDATATSAPPAYSGGSTGTAGVPFTGGVSAPTSTAPAATSAGAATTVTSNPAVPLKTGAIGAAALFGGAAMLVNW